MDRTDKEKTQGEKWIISTYPNTKKWVFMSYMLLELIVPSPPSPGHQYHVSVLKFTACKLKQTTKVAPSIFIRDQDFKHLWVKHRL